MEYSPARQGTGLLVGSRQDEPAGQSVQNVLPVPL